MNALYNLAAFRMTVDVALEGQGRREGWSSQAVRLLRRQGPGPPLLSGTAAPSGCLSLRPSGVLSPHPGCRDLPPLLSASLVLLWVPSTPPFHCPIFLSFPQRGSPLEPLRLCGGAGKPTSSFIFSATSRSFAYLSYFYP